MLYVLSMDDYVAQARNYIQQQLASGQPADVVLQQLRAAGWQEELIQQAFAALQIEVMPAELLPGQRIEPGQPVLMQTEVHVSDNPVAPVTPAAEVAPAAVAAPQPVAPTPIAQPVAAVEGPQASGRHRGRLKTGWRLFTTSLSILNGNKYLLRYLLMTGLWIFFVTVAFVTAYYFVFLATFLNDKDVPAIMPFVAFALVCLDYLLIYFFINLYAAGLAANVFDIFAGNKQPYRAYMHIAWKKAPALFVFSVANTTIGLLLRTLVERIRFVGWLLSWLIGTAWSLGTSFTVPIIVAGDKVGGIAAIKQSFAFFKQTWGEGIAAKASVNVPLGILQFALLGAFYAIVFTVGEAVGATGIFALLILYLVLSIALAVVGSFSNSLVNIALFYYASYRIVPPAFSEGLLNDVFIKRGPRWFKRKSAQAS